MGVTQKNLPFFFERVIVSLTVCLDFVQSLRGDGFSGLPEDQVIFHFINVDDDRIPFRELAG